VLNAHVARLRQAAHIDSQLGPASDVSGVWQPRTMDLDAALSHVPRRSFTAASSRDKLRRMRNVRLVFSAQMVIVALITLFQLGATAYGAAHFDDLAADPVALALFDTLVVLSMAVLCAPLMVLFAIVSIRRHADPEQVLPAPADALVSPDADQADLEDRFVSPRPPTPFEGDDKDQRVVAQLAEMRQARSDAISLDLSPNPDRDIEASPRS